MNQNSELIVDTEIDIDLENSNVPDTLEKTADDIIEQGAKELKSFLEKLINSNVPLSEKLAEIQKIKTAMMLPSFNVLTGKEINPAKMTASASIFEMVQKMEQSLYKKSEYEAKEEVDFHHPKIQKAFDWIVEGVIESMQEAGIPDLDIQNFINIFGIKMTGFEEEIQKKMKGLSSKAVEKLENPLLAKYREVKQGKTSKSSEE